MLKGTSFSAFDNSPTFTGTVTFPDGSTWDSTGPILISTDAGATLGPVLTLFRNSASPAANDILGGINFTGKSSTGVTRTYGSIQQTIVTATNAAEDGSIKFYTMLGGTLTLAATLNNLGTFIPAGNINLPNSIKGNSSNSFLFMDNGTGMAIYSTGVNATGNGIGLDYATDGTLKIRNRAFNADAAITASSGAFSGAVINTASTIQYMGSGGGAADVITLTPSPALTAYTTGAIYFYKSTAANATTTPTMNISGLGAKTIVKRAATALAGGDITNGGMEILIYDGTNMQLLNPIVN